MKNYVKKVFTNIINNILQNTLDYEQPREQAGPTNVFNTVKNTTYGLGFHTVLLAKVPEEIQQITNAAGNGIGSKINLS